MEGKGSRGRRGPNRDRSNQVEEGNFSLNDLTYMDNAETLSNSTSDWYLDSGTTSHITNDKNAFTEFTATSATLVLGIRNPAMTLGYGTISVKFKINNKFITHKLQHTLYLPEAPNCLLSASRFDETGGKVIIQKGKCSLEDKNRNTVGHGILQRRLYLMDAETVYPAKANFALATKKTWDQWHQKFRHISQKSLENLTKNRMVEGFEINQSSTPSITCEACIQAKQS